jgi:hypothetical protein
MCLAVCATNQMAIVTFNLLVRYWLINNSSLWCYIRLLIHFIPNLSLVQNSEGRCKAVSGLEGDKETSTTIQGADDKLGQTLRTHLKL